MKQYTGPVAAITFGLPIVQVTTNHHPQVGKTTLGLYLGQDGVATVAESDGNQLIDLMVNVKRDEAGDALTATISAPGFFCPITKWTRYVHEDDMRQSFAQTVEDFVLSYQGQLYEQVA
jgi:hypothetical protein